MKVIIKNTKEDERKCKTIIQIDGMIVFTSDVYTWEQPEISDSDDSDTDGSDSVTETEFEVATGSNWNSNLKGAIRNISIKAYE